MHDLNYHGTLNTYIIANIFSGQSYYELALALLNEFEFPKLMKKFVQQLRTKK